MVQLGEKPFLGWVDSSAGDPGRPLLLYRILVGRDWRGIQSLSHADHVLDGEAQLPIQRDHAGVRSSHLQVDFHAAPLGEVGFQPPDERCGDALASVSGRNRHCIDPSPVAVITAHGRAHNGPVRFRDEEEVTLDCELLLYDQGRCVMRRVGSEYLAPEANDRYFIGISVWTD